MIGAKALEERAPIGAENMNVSRSGLIALARSEAVVLSTYKDRAGVLTIGVGHTAGAGAPVPAKGMKLTPAQAIDLFRRDLAKFERQVDQAVKVPLAQHEFDALVSFHFNTGAIGSASLVGKLNAGDRQGAAAGLMAWVKATVNGKKVTLDGLVNRRTHERRLFEAADYGDVSAVPVYDVYPGPARLVAAGELFAAAEPAEPAPPIVSPEDIPGRLLTLEARIARIERIASIAGEA